MVNWHLFDPLQSKFDLILVKNVLIDGLMKMSKQTAKHFESGSSELLRSCWSLIDMVGNFQFWMQNFMILFQKCFEIKERK